ncbi:hypothetical protein Tco_0696610 [Tanacetum coccineum]
MNRCWARETCRMYVSATNGTTVLLNCRDLASMQRITGSQRVVQNHDENNVFANERRHSEQPESINDTYVLEKDDSNVTPDSSNIWKATSCRDSFLIALQNKQNEFEKYKAFNDRTLDYDILQTKLNETLGLLARKDIDIKEGPTSKEVKSKITLIGLAERALSAAIKLKDRSVPNNRSCEVYKERK